MYHGRLRINLADKEVQLHFNNFSDFEIKKIFGAENLLEEIKKRLADNELAFICDLIWIGVVGHREASLTDTQISRQEIRAAIADADVNAVADVSKAFFDHMGQNLEKEEPNGEKKS